MSADWFAGNPAETTFTRFKKLLLLKIQVQYLLTEYALVMLTVLK